MYYLQSRYYDPAVGRFINGDEATYVGVASSVTGYNLSAYCHNDTPNLNDPLGHYAGAFALSPFLLSSLSNALPGIIAGIRSSLASIKAAITTSWFVPVCIAATAIAIIGITYVVHRTVSLMASATRVISAVKNAVAHKGIDEGSVLGYTVYVVTEIKSHDVVYVGISKQYKKRKARHHSKKFPKEIYEIFPICTGLTKSAARAMEQTIITAYTLDTLINMINSIAPSKWHIFKSEFKQMTTLIESWIDPE